MRNSILKFFLTFLLAGTVFSQSIVKSAEPILGFAAENVQKQRGLENKFDAALKAENLRNWMKRLSARPHHVGSPYGKENAEFIAAQFKSWGFDTQIEQFDVLFPTPKTRLVEMTAPEKFTAKLGEPELKEDATTDSAKRATCRLITPIRLTAM